MIHSNNKERFCFKIIKVYNNCFYFYLRYEEVYCLVSNYYTYKTNCLKGINSVIRNSKNEERFIIKQPYFDTWRVYLKAGNGRTIVKSNFLDAEEEAKNFIKDLKCLSLDTPVVDNTKLKLKP